MDDLRTAVVYVDEKGNLGSTWMGVGVPPSRANEQAVVVETSFNPHKKKYDHLTQTFEPVGLTVFDKYTPDQIRQAVRDNDRGILDEIAAEADKKRD